MSQLYARTCAQPLRLFTHKPTFSTGAFSRRQAVSSFTSFDPSSFSSRFVRSSSSSSSSTSPSTTTTTPAKPFMVTTPIYYVNSSPHLGHLYSSVLADATARYHVLKKATGVDGDGDGDGVSTSPSSASNSAPAPSPPPPRRVLFSTGTDEHGQKVEAAAAAAGISPVSLFCDRVSSEYKEMSKQYLIEYTDFIRTTDPAHAAVVRWLWRRLERAGYITLGQHEGWYCQSDEAFLTDLQVVTRKEYLAKQAALKKELEQAEKAKAEAETEKARLEEQQQQQQQNSTDGTTPTKQKQKQKQQQQQHQQQQLPASQRPPAPPPTPKKKWTLQELEAKVSAESGHPVERVSETNYMFDLPALRDQLLALHDRHLTQGENQGVSGSERSEKYPFVTPPSRAAFARAYLAADSLRAVSVSRRRDKVPWAIPVPEPLQQDAVSSSTTASTVGASSSSLSSTSSSPASAHSVYVWLDALANYLTAAARGSKWRTKLEEEQAKNLRAASSTSSSASSPASTTTTLIPDLPLDAHYTELFPAWPADVHIVGKDILKFHSIYWPAFCIGSGLPPPKRIVAHGHWTVNKVKMSKSIGNVIAPASLLQENGGLFTADAVRYFLLREAKCESDGDYSSFVAGQRCAKECSDTFGNLANRILNRTFMPGGTPALHARAKLDLPWDQLKSFGVEKQLPSQDGGGGGAGGGGALASTPPHVFHGTVILSPEQCELLAMTVDLQARVSKAYENVDPGPGLEAIVNVLQVANKVHSSAKPWKLKVSAEIAAKWNAEAEVVEAHIRECGREKKGMTLDELLRVGSSRFGGGGDLQVNYTFTEDNLRMAGALYTIMEVLRICAILLQPAMPTVTPRLLEAFLGMGDSAALRVNQQLTTWRSAAHPCVFALPHHFRIDARHQPLILFPKPPAVHVEGGGGGGGTGGAAAAGGTGGAPPMTRKQAMREEKEKKKLREAQEQPQQEQQKQQ